MKILSLNADKLYLETHIKQQETFSISKQDKILIRHIQVPCTSFVPIVSQLIKFVQIDVFVWTKQRNIVL